MTPPTKGLRLVNGSNSVAKVELRVQPGDEVEIPDGALIDADRSQLRPIVAAKAEPETEAPAKRPTKKAAAKP